MTSFSEGNKLRPRTKKNETGLQSEDDLRNYMCGIGSFRPFWMQRFATPKCFLLVFSILVILQGAYRNYFVGILSTLEKRFAISSKTLAWIIIAENVSPVMTILAGFYGGSSSRPAWLGAGMFIVIISCIINVTPYFIYGVGNNLINQNHLIKTNTTGYEFCTGVNRTFENCMAAESVGAEATVFMFFVAYILNGLGSSMFYVLGISYMDDNVKKKDSPMYFGCMFALRLFGPSLGFFLASYSLAMYEDLSLQPEIPKTDPRWIGAWWLGYVFLAVCFFVFTIPIILFPKKLWRSEAIEKQETRTELDGISEITSKELFQVLKRLFRNPVFVTHVTGLVFTLNGLLGYFLAMPKYMETQFRKSASTANFFFGSTNLLTILLGILFGGAVIKKFKPRPNLVSAYIVLVDLFLLTVMLAATFLGCRQMNLSGRTDLGRFTPYNDCSLKCGCTTQVFQPVCSIEEQTTYFSPCFAGCEKQNATSDVMLNCQCLKSSLEKEAIANTTAGYCADTCTMFIPFIIILSIGKMIYASSKVGNVLITIRCIDPKDKSVGVAILLSVASIFGFIPYPFIYGLIMDSSCLVWEQRCGKTGNCWVYDADTFRFALHGTSVGFLFLGAVFNFLTYLLSGRLKNFYEESEAFAENETDNAMSGEEDDENIMFMRNMGRPGIVQGT